jgi:hypothetical protein
MMTSTERLVSSVMRVATAPGGSRSRCPTTELVNGFRLAENDGSFKSLKLHSSDRSN